MPQRIQVLIEHCPFIASQGVVVRRHPPQADFSAFERSLNLLAVVLDQRKVGSSLVMLMRRVLARVAAEGLPMPDMVRYLISWPDLASGAKIIQLAILVTKKDLLMPSPRAMT